MSAEGTLGLYIMLNNTMNYCGLSKYISCNEILV